MGHWLVVSDAWALGRLGDLLRAVNESSEPLESHPAAVFQVKAQSLRHNQADRHVKPVMNNDECLEIRLLDGVPLDAGPSRRSLRMNEKLCSLTTIVWSPRDPESDWVAEQWLRWPS